MEVLQYRLNGIFDISMNMGHPPQNFSYDWREEG
jgi:hypothetical protein